MFGDVGTHAGPWSHGSFVFYSKGNEEPLGEVLQGGQVGYPLDLGIWRSLVMHWPCRRGVLGQNLGRSLKPGPRCCAGILSLWPVWANLLSVACVVGVSHQLLFFLGSYSAISCERKSRFPL